MKERLKRVIEVTTWLEKETARNVLNELLSLAEKLAREFNYTLDIEEFKKRRDKKR